MRKSDDRLLVAGLDAEPAPALLPIAQRTFRDLWDASEPGAGRREGPQGRLAEIDRQSEALLGRIVEATSAPVIAAYEKKTGALALERLLIAEKLENRASPAGRFDEMFELAWRFLSSPWKLW